MVNKTLNNIKAVIFDFDDTLVATHEAIWNLHRYIAKTYYGRILSDELLSKHWGRPIPELMKHYYKTEDNDEAMKNLLAHRDEFPKLLLEHASDAINRLHNENVIVGIVSATTRPLLEYDAKLVGLPIEKMTYIQTAEDSQYHKPDGRVFNALKEFLHDHKIVPEETLYIGDGIHDFNAAREAELKFIGVATGLVTVSDFEEAGAEAINDLSELPAIVVGVVKK
jgi:phosphoglycolate phosphatase